MKFKTKKPTYKMLADVLSVSVSAIKQYNQTKLRLMILGLWLENEKEYNKSTLDMGNENQCVNQYGICE